ncbi:MAG: DUF5752 family protein, partial [Candidatus Bathyarchaeia archaeon]
KHLLMATPSEVVKKYEPVDEIDVPELGGTVSWADLERDTSCWLGNTMQWAYYTSIKRLEPLVKEAKDKEFLKVWRCLQTSDHLYYMFTGGGAPGEVHSYFSPFKNPVDAYVTAQAVAMDFENRVRLAIMAANEPFLFYGGVGEENYTGVMAWSLKGMVNALKRVELESLEFHFKRGDFENWARHSLHDEVLAKELEKVRLSKVRGLELRDAVVQVFRERFRVLLSLIREGTEYF